MRRFGLRLLDHHLLYGQLVPPAPLQASQHAAPGTHGQIRKRHADRDRANGVQGLELRGGTPH